MKTLLRHLIVLSVIAAIIFVPLGIGMLFPMGNGNALIIHWGEGIIWISVLLLIIVIYAGIYKFFK